MKIETNEEYKELIKRHAPSSPTLKNCLFAFLAGGFLCFLGEWLAYLYRLLGIDSEHSYILVSVSYIFLASLATALGFFDMQQGVLLHCGKYVHQISIRQPQEKWTL